VVLTVYIPNHSMQVSRDRGRDNLDMWSLLCVFQTTACMVSIDRERY
jgi:hypothetical protein